MTTWDDLLGPLAETPRENGSTALAETATFLADVLVQAGVAVERVPFVAHPYRLRLAGLVILFGTLAYAWALWTRRARAALAIAVLVPVILLAELDFFVPLFGWPGATTEEHIVGRVPPAQAPVRRLIFTAHYDTKTDLFDHVERAPVELLGLPVAVLMIAAALVAWRRPARRLGRLGAVTAVVYGIAAAASFSAGALVRARSPGALDDGAACAILVRLAARLAAGPRLAATDVEVALLAAEEIGVQGSWLWARERFGGGTGLPTWVVNLDPVGASRELAVVRRETFATRGYPPDAQLVKLLDAVHRQERGRSLPLTRFGGGTDGRSLLAHGVPAATLISEVPDHVFVRGLHSVRDDRSRIDRDALDEMVAYLLAVTRAVDAERLDADG
jgi:acetylornithine deacetylase/succinyl-diaminopimelate desuccinylase-like protein